VRLARFRATGEREQARPAFLHLCPWFRGPSSQEPTDRRTQVGLVPDDGDRDALATAFFRAHRRGASHPTQNAVPVAIADRGRFDRCDIERPTQDLGGLSRAYERTRTDRVNRAHELPQSARRTAHLPDAARGEWPLVVVLSGFCPLVAVAGRSVADDEQVERVRRRALGAANARARFNNRRGWGSLRNWRRAVCVGDWL